MNSSSVSSVDSSTSVVPHCAQNDKSTLLRGFIPTLLCALLLCGAAHAQDLEDVPLQDPSVPTLSPTQVPTVAPTPTAKPTTTKPTQTPAKPALPRPAPTQPAAPTQAPPPTRAPAALESAPLEDQPLEDAPIPDAPVASANTPVAGANAPATDAAPAASIAPIEDAPIADAVPGQTPVSAPTLSPDNAAHQGDEGEPMPAEALADPNAFLWQAFYAGALVALMCGFLGLYVVTRRMVFIGVALAEISSAGIAFSLLVSPFLATTALGFLVPHLTIIGALAFMVLGVTLLSLRWAPRVLPPDAPVGVFYLLATALGILLIAKSAQGEGHMLTLLRGDVLAVYPNETLQMAIVFAVLALVHGLFGKEFLLISLDRDSAATQGYNAARWDFLLLLTIGVAVSLAIRSVGVLLTTAMLVLPAATALLTVPRWKWALVAAPLIGLVAVALGLYLSFVGDFPASAVIVAVMFAFLLPALVWKTMRR